MAEASGLWLVAEDERDAFAASTRGTGELIAAAVEAGAREVIVAVGGSATTDGGAGALEALDEAGVEPPITVVCDVRTAWEDAPRVFGPQKGADAAHGEAASSGGSTSWPRAPPRDPRGVPMTGCAGGLSGGLWAFRGAKLVPGAAYVLDAVGFDDRMRAARFVVTGEGRLDAQTLEGKACAEVATRARQGGVACHAVVGRERARRLPRARARLRARVRGERRGRARGGRAGAGGDLAERIGSATMDPADAFHRMGRSMRRTGELLALGAPDSRTLQLDGVTAAITPAAPERSVLNGVVVEDFEKLEPQLDTVAAAYAAAGVRAWTVWVPEHETAARELLGGAGHVLDATPAAMLLDLDELLEPGQGVPECSTEWDMEAAGSVNDAAYGDTSGLFARAMGGLPPDTGRMYLAQADGRPASFVLVHDDEENCEFWIATTQSAAARRAGAAAGGTVYERLGYEFGHEMWEPRLVSRAGSTSTRSRRPRSASVPA